MKTLNIEDYELLGLFENEPLRAMNDESWAMDSSYYSWRKGELTLGFSIIPNHGDIRIMLKLKEECIYDYDAMDIKRVSVEKDGMEIETKREELIVVKLRPEIQIIHKPDFI